MKDLIKVKCPAKINLTLEVVNKREDGFHNIKSIMQMIDLYDYLTIQICESNKTEIILSGTSSEIPYNETNLVYKAAKLFLEESKIEKLRVKIHIDKNIPISAGLAGGSTDAAGTIWGLNQLLNKFDLVEMNSLCAKLGSDLNVCLNGGCLLATSRGENTQKLPNSDYSVTLIKPKNLGISAKEAYTKYANKALKPQNDMTEKMNFALNNNEDIRPFLYNDLEYAVFDDYEELQDIKKVYPNAVMSGSGSTYIILENVKNIRLNENYEVFSNLKFIPIGVGLSD